MRRFSGPSRAVPVSLEEGRHPAWAADGRRFFFVSSQGLEEVAVTVEDGELDLGVARVVLDLETTLGYRTYDPKPDGSGFIALEPRDGTGGFGVMLNLGRELRELTGGRS